MSASPLTITQKALWLNSDTNVHTAQSLRRSLADIVGPGVRDLNSWRVRQRVAGATQTVDVTDAATISEAYVRGTSVNEQGMYLVSNVAPSTGTIDGIYNLDISASDPANPRIDQIYLKVEDAQHAGANNLATLHVVTGTPTGGATLDNRTGVGAAPAGSSILLADILVPATSTSVVTANIRDRRPIALAGSLPWLGSTGTQIDAVSFVPHPSGCLANQNQSSLGQIAVTTHDNMQSAAAFILPRRITSATRIRWRYTQGGTAAATNYVLFVADASGRVVAQTAATAFAGALNVTTEASVALTATTTFEEGTYYVGIGLAPLTAASAVKYAGLVTGQTTNGPPGASVRNVCFRSAAGGTTVPTTILAFTDSASLTAATEAPMAPLCSLSVT